MTSMTEEEFHREWYDETDPPDRGIRLQEEDTCKAWSELQVGDRIRWKTATFVKRGSIVSVHRRSLVVLFDAHSKPTTIPDGKWYFVEGKAGNLNEHLVTISTPPMTNIKMNGDPRPTGKEGIIVSNQDAISPNEAAAILGTDSKNIRRMIRNGKLRAMRDGGRWVLSRKDIEGL